MPNVFPALPQFYEGVHALALAALLAVENHGALENRMPKLFFTHRQFYGGVHALQAVKQSWCTQKPHAKFISCTPTTL